MLATGLSLVLVGLPVFLLHWLPAQRDARRDEEEHASRVRAVFFYTVRVFTLMPVVYSALAFFNRQLLAWMGTANLGLFGNQQSNADNLISIGVNLVVFAYFSSVLRSDWRSAPAGSFLVEARRLYRYLWVMFGLALTIFGVQGILDYLFNLPLGSAYISDQQLAYSLPLAVIGALIWASTWVLVQRSQEAALERESLLRLVVLYLTSLAGVVGVLAASGRVLSNLFAVLLGRPQTPSEFLGETSAALAAVIPLAVMWAYYGRILDREMSVMTAQPRRAGVRRLYRSILSALGLAVSLAGLVTLIHYLASSLFNLESLGYAWPGLNTSLASLVIGLPLWLASWVPLQFEAAALAENGDRARRSLVRRAYLYLAVFAFVVGLMLAAGNLLYNLINHLLGTSVTGIGELAVERLLDLAVLVGLLIYHLRVLQRDGRAAQKALGALHAAFAVLIIVPEQLISLAQSITQVLQRQAPRMAVTIHPAERGAPDDALLSAKLVVLPSGLVSDPPAALTNWLSAYQGQRLVLPQVIAGWNWLGLNPRPEGELAEEAAAIIRQLAEGESPHGGRPSNPWSLAGYVLGGLFALILLAALFGLLASSLYG